MLNEVNLLGRLTAAPELKYTTNKIPVLSFCIAIDRRYQQKDGERATDFINCVAWRNTAEFVNKHFAKGDPIIVKGELQTRKYTDDSGKNRVAVEVAVEYVRFVPTKNSGNKPAETPPDNDGFLPVDDDRLPF